MIPDSMVKDLDKFFANHTIGDVNREKFLTCGLKDPRYQLDIMLFFMNDWHGDYTDYQFIEFPGKGAIFILPVYWISVPKPLCMWYFTELLNEFYNNTVTGWGIGYVTDDGSGSSGNNCGCPC
ncbi:MAG: hypothetical protein NC489_38880 [Ruminococcus flavefaciens]|nr:hypothetical protein [Ruminococcus flavefaciens]